MQHQCCTILGVFLAKNFGNRLIYLRKKERLSQEEAAQKIGIGLRTLQSHEYGQWPNRNNLEKYIDFYKCSRIWLLTGEGEPFQGNDTIKLPIKDVKIDYSVARPDPFGTASSALKEIFDSNDQVLIDSIQNILQIFQIYIRKNLHTEIKKDPKKLGYEKVGAEGQ